MAKAFASVFPESLFVSRSDKSVDWLVDFARYQGLECVVLVSALGDALKSKRFELRGLRVTEAGWSESFSAVLAVEREPPRKLPAAGELSLEVKEKKAARLFALLVDQACVCPEAACCLREDKGLFSVGMEGGEPGLVFGLEGVSFAG